MNSLPACCMDFEIELRQLLFPDTLDAAGQEFVEAHDLSDYEYGDLLNNVTDLGLGANGERRVRLRHRCAQLQDNGRCRIYADRPAICRSFDCGTRQDCACGGAGTLPADGFVVWHD